MSTKVEEIVNRIWMVREKNGSNFLIRGNPTPLAYSLGFPTGADYLGDKFVFCRTKKDATNEAKLYRFAQKQKFGSVQFPVEPVPVTVTWEVAT